MPSLLEYPASLQTLTAGGLKSLYFNSGAFGFASPESPHYLGWLIAPDPTLRPAMVPHARLLNPPAVPCLAQNAIRAWTANCPGSPAWVMPMSHWSYELDFGSRDWMPEALGHLGLDPQAIAALNTGNPVQFLPDEAPALQDFLVRLLTQLKGSDFMLAFPGRPLLCTIHHHQQLWWATPDLVLLKHLEALAP